MRRKKIKVDLDGVNASLVDYTFDEFKLNALILHFDNERRILSTRDGVRNVQFVCNLHIDGSLVERISNEYKDKLPVDLESEVGNNLLQSLRLDPLNTAWVSTAVSMKHLETCELSYDDLKVCCFATAGVKKNSMRMGVDRALWSEKNCLYHKLGTINLFILTNASLTEGAMVRAIMTATEAKVATLQDFNIKSTFTPNKHATGTGTDNLIIVSGTGPIEIRCTNGHTKAGELIAFSTRKALEKALRWFSY